MSDPRPSLRGKAILVTGAATGIGRATAELLGASGARVFGIGLDAEAGRDLAERAKERTRQSSSEADVTPRPTCAPPLRRCSGFRRIDGVVNSAGVNQTGTRLGR